MWWVWTRRRGGKREVTAREQRMDACRTSGRLSRTSCGRCCEEWSIARATGCCLWAPPRCPPLSPSEYPHQSAAHVGRCWDQPPVLAPVPGQRDIARMGQGHARESLLLRPAAHLCQLAMAPCNHIVCALIITHLRQVGGHLSVVCLHGCRLVRDTQGARGCADGMGEHHRRPHGHSCLDRCPPTLPLSSFTGFEILKTCGDSGGVHGSHLAPSPTFLGGYTRNVAAWALSSAPIGARNAFIR